MLLVCLWDNVAYGMYKTYGCVGSASEYGCGMFANALENIVKNTTSYEETIFCVIGT